MPAPVAEATPLYRPGTTSSALKEIVEDSLEELFTSPRPLRLAQCNPRKP